MNPIVYKGGFLFKLNFTDRFKFNRFYTPNLFIPLPSQVYSGTFGSKVKRSVNIILWEYSK